MGGIIWNYAKMHESNMTQCKNNSHKHVEENLVRAKSERKITYTETIARTRKLHNQLGFAEDVLLLLIESNLDPQSGSLAEVHNGGTLRAGA